MDPSYVKPPEWKEVLEFVQKQAADDRSTFDRLLRHSLWVLGLAVAAASAIGIWVLGRTADEALKSARTQMETRITQEFETENIRPLIDNAADKVITSGRLTKDIEEAVSKRVKTEIDQQEVFIQKIINTETTKQVLVRVKQLRTDLQRFEPLLSLIDKTTGGRKICIITSRIGLQRSLVSLYAPASWNPQQCADTGKQLNSEGIRLGCIFEDGSSFGELTGSTPQIPKRNCGWSNP